MITSLMWALVVLVAIWRLDRFGHRVLNLQDPAKAPDTTPPPIPDDLTAMAMMESEKIAQDDVLKVIRERFEQLRPGSKTDHDAWNKVRTAIGVAGAERA